jgi:hypothetical protein
MDRRTIQQGFRDASLFLSSDALRTLLEYLDAAGADQDALDRVIDAVEARRTERDPQIIYK